MIDRHGGTIYARWEIRHHPFGGFIATNFKNILAPLLHVLKKFDMVPWIKSGSFSSMLQKTPREEMQALQIPAPRMETIEFKLVGTAPYMQARFAHKAMLAMRAKHEAGSVAKKGKKRDARNFEDDYKGAMHVSTDGWVGIPASAFRAAAVSACRLVGYKMTVAKLSIFIEADGFDRVDGTPLVRIEGNPEPSEMPVRNATGVVDIRVRPLWRKWSCALRVQYDQDQFTRVDVANLLMRVGGQVGIGEGRPDSKSSCGLGFGLFCSKES